jgi:glycerate-2-kinase
LVCAVGKAAAGMLSSFEESALAPIRGSICATSPHPTPTGESCRTARLALDLATRTDSASCLVLLISGGASAMIALPAEGITLDDKIAAVKVMLTRGMPIEEMNAVRKHLSAIKGGQLATHAHSCCTLAISDVIGTAEDDLSVIGSGPGVADPSTFGDAVRALRARDAWSDLPGGVRARLSGGEAGEIAETPKPGDPRFAHASGFVIGGRRDAMQAARVAAERLGYRVVLIDEPTLGEARAAGPMIVARARERAGSPDRTCVISSGETTVHVRGQGRGGRNQELALAALASLASSRSPMTLVSLGTDGVDGPTDAAGAVADERSLSRATALGLPAVDAVLAANDAYTFFDRLDDLVRTGPTGTNVGDLQIVLTRESNFTDA